MPNKHDIKEHGCLYNSGSQSMIFIPAAPASAGNVLEIQILKPSPRSSESETLGMGLNNPF